MNLSPHAIKDEIKSPVELDELGIDCLNSSAGVSPLGRHLKDERRLEHLPIETIDTRQRALTEAGILVAVELSIDPRKHIVGRQPSLDDELLPFKRDAEEFRPGG